MRWPGTPVWFNFRGGSSYQHGHLRYQIVQTVEEPVSQQVFDRVWWAVEGPVKNPIRRTLSDKDT